MEIKLTHKGEQVKKIQSLLYLKTDGIFGPITEKAVKDFQILTGIKPTGIVDDVTYYKLTYNPFKLSKRNISEIILHCSATEEGKSYTKEDIRKWHIAKGYTEIGYHYVVYINGSVNIGRNVNLIGAHCVDHNSKSIGICYIGGLRKGKPADTRTPKQKESLIALLRLLKRMYPNAKIYGHNEFANKACPCFDVKEYSYLL